MASDVKLEHLGSSLRVFRRVGDGVQAVRTFSGVRGGMTQGEVGQLLAGIGGLVAAAPTNAALTTRAALAPGGGA